jgi:uncharacterized protein
MTDTAPTSQTDRIGEVDIVRGFALFGVLWMNVHGMGGFLVPEDKIHGLTQFQTLETVIDFWANLLLAGKAQALFSLLFGFGFAMMMERIDQRGGDGTKVYLRRLTILLIVGIAHTALLWAGDILNAYAAMGFLLLLTRRWRGGWLLAAGLTLAVLLPLGVLVYYQVITPAGQAPAFVSVMEAGAAARFPIVMGHDYPAFVVAMLKSSFVEFYAQPVALSYLGWILGRFMIGSWIFRQGWLQAPQRYLLGYAVVSATFIPIGLLLGLRRLIMEGMKLEPMEWATAVFRSLGTVSQLMLAVGYGALLILLCQIPAVRRALSGLGTVGQMALTNYLTQSLFYVFVLYGFGLGLLPWMGPTLSLAFSIAVFTLQVLFSRWWTYGARPELRRG